MYQEFFINKQSGTYAETLEAFGVANLIAEILKRHQLKGITVTFEDKGIYYLVSTNKTITEEMLTTLTYFQVVKFVKKEATQIVPDGILDYFDYPNQKAELDKYKKRFEEIEKNKELNQEKKRKARKALSEEKDNQFNGAIDAAFDVYREIIKNPYVSFSKLFDNFHLNQAQFPALIREILSFYAQKPSIKRTFKLPEEKPTAQQLFNPNQGKGLNKNKANNISMGNLDSNWISETMKTSGAFSMMICQYVKVGSTYDLKLFVPDFHNITLSEAKNLVIKFKQNLKSTSAVKLDILNILDFTNKFILETPQYKGGKVRNTVKGFHSVYQKDLGQNKAVANIAFINTPDFVEYQTEEEGHDWTIILEHQRSIISNIDELGDAIQGLQSYRNFLGSVGNSALHHFSKFSFWYAAYLMQALAKKKFARCFSTEILNKFYTNMDNRLSKIINDEGFLAVAGAIRNSTIRLQIKSRFQETHKKFEIRYGFAQELINKSKSKDDLVKFMGNFLAKYNSETAKHKEKNAQILFRPNIRKEDEEKFFLLLDEHPPHLVGSLLASFGFALEKYDAKSEEQIVKLQEEAAKLGYQLVKIEEESANAATEQNDENLENE